MITPNDILQKLAAMVGEKFPGEQVYQDLTPTDFQRPSSLVVYDGGKVDVGCGCQTVELRLQYTLSTFTPVDAYGHSDTEALHIRQMALIGMLLPGYIKVKGRAPKVGEVKLDGGYDFDSVTVTFHIALDRSEFEAIAQHSDMLTLHLRTEVETYG